MIFYVGKYYFGKWITLPSYEPITFKHINKICAISPKCWIFFLNNMAFFFMYFHKIDSCLIYVININYLLTRIKIFNSHFFPLFFFPSVGFLKDKSNLLRHIVLNLKKKWSSHFQFASVRGNRFICRLLLL